MKKSNQKTFEYQNGNLVDISEECNSSASSKLLVGSFLSSVLAVASQAAVVAPDFTSNIADLAIILGSMIGFGAVVWGARRLLGFTS